MIIEVKTAVEGCADYCPRFEVKTIKLYENNDIFFKTYYCEHLDECKAMLNALAEAEENLKNING